MRLFAFKRNIKQQKKKKKNRNLQNTLESVAKHIIFFYRCLQQNKNIKHHTHTNLKLFEK